MRINRAVVVCATCGSSFEVPRSSFLRGRKYCSRECWRPSSEIERFFRKVEKQQDGGCWLWTGAKSRDGYGSFQYARGSLAHRFSYELEKGVIPDGLTIDHLCRTPLCVNPQHLQAVPVAVNVLRGEGVAARYVRRSHCSHGHPLTGPGADITAVKGARRCNICNRENSRRWRARKVAP